MKRYTSIEDFPQSKLHSAITKMTVGCVDIENLTNQTGIFRFKKEYQQRTKEEKAKFAWFYYVTDPGKPMGEIPPLQAPLRIDNTTVIEESMEVVEVSDEKRSRRTRKRPVKDLNADDKKNPPPNQKDDGTKPEKLSAKERKEIVRRAWIKFHHDAQAACDEEVERRLSKRQRVKDAVDAELERSSQSRKEAELKKEALEMEKKALEAAKEAKERVAKVAVDLKLFSYFDSNDAKSMFCPKEGETVQECLKRRIHLLSTVINDPDGYKRLLAEEHKIDDTDNEPTPFQRFQMRDKAMYLRLLYMNSLEMSPKGHTFAQCCVKTLEQLKHTTSIEMSSAQLVQKLNREFRETETFLPPKTKKHGSNKKAAKKDAEQRGSA